MKSINIFNVLLSLFGLSLVAVVVIPEMAGAATLIGTLGTVNSFITGLTRIVISLAIVVFFWGLVVYLMNVGDSEKRKEGIHIMIWGVVAIFVMVSVWGIVELLQGTFSVQNKDPIIPNAIQLGNLRN